MKRNDFFIPILFISITNQCNGRCISCSYWKSKKSENLLSHSEILSIITFLVRHGLRIVIFTGGEPLLKGKDLFNLCSEIKSQFPSLVLRLLTNGILLNRYKREIIKSFDVVVVSLDGASKETYLKIRGINAFKNVVEGIKSLKKMRKDLEIRIRCVVQKQNYEEIPKIIELTQNIKAEQISFLPADVFLDYSFGRKGGVENYKDIILNPEELKKYRGIINLIIKNKKKYLRKNFLRERTKDLLFVHQFYSAVNGLEKFPKVKCNALWFSTIIDSNGDVFPCFFLSKVGSLRKNKLEEILSSTSMQFLRKKERKGKLKECKHCVSPLFWK